MYEPAAMDRRRWIVAAMWVVALAAMAAIYVLVEPRSEDAHTVRGDASPLFVAGQDRAPAASRLELPVEEDQGSPSLYRGGRRHTGRSPFRGPARPGIAWRLDTDARITAQAVVGDDGTIFVGDHERQLHAIGPDGEQRWQKPVFGPVWSAAAVLGDTVYVGSDADTFFALDAADGTTRWRIHVDGDADGAVSTAPDGSLRFTAGPDLYAVEPDGAIRWRFRAPGPFVLSTPAVDGDGTVYIGSVDDHLYAVDAEGRMRWAYATDGDISSSPAIGDDGTIYFGSDDQRVHAVTRDGELRWKAELGGYVRAPVALGRDGSVIAAVYGPSPRLVALEASTGDERWYFPVGIEESTERGIASGPLVDADGFIYFGAPDDFVYSLTRDGSMRWIVPVGADVDAAPILTPDGTLVVGCDDGFVYAIADGGDMPDGGAPDASADGGDLPDGGGADASAGRDAGGGGRDSGAR